MASAKKWILLANYDDKTMLRNALAFHISEMSGTAWTPNSRFVELYLNGNIDNYRGDTFNFTTPHGLPYKRWPILGQEILPNPEAAGSYQGEIDYLKDWMTKRIAYMDASYLK
jgi:hypothetical protein